MHQVPEKLKLGELPPSCSLTASCSSTILVESSSFSFWSGHSQDPRDYVQGAHREPLKGTFQVLEDSNDRQVVSSSADINEMHRESQLLHELPLKWYRRRTGRRNLYQDSGYCGSTDTTAAYCSCCTVAGFHSVQSEATSAVNALIC